MPEAPYDVLLIRDPDCSTWVASDVELTVIEIDIGQSWASYRDFADCLASGDEEALEYERALLAMVAELPRDSKVRQGVENFFAEARDG